MLWAERKAIQRHLINGNQVTLEDAFSYRTSFVGKLDAPEQPLIANSSVLLVPEIPAQAHPWNNEYILSVSTQYTEHGMLRTGIYGRKLKANLLDVPQFVPPKTARFAPFFRVKTQQPNAFFCTTMQCFSSSIQSKRKE